MKKSIIVLAVCLATMLSNAADLPDFPFVFAVGRASKELAPNVATMEVRIQCFHENSSNALALAGSASVTLVDQLLKHGLKTGDIVTYEIGKEVVQKNDDNRETTILGYNVSRRFEVTIRDIKAYPDVAASLLTLDNVGRIYTSFDRNDRKDIEDSLIQDACKDAKKEALAMAKGFDRTLGDVFAISTQGFTYLGAEFGLPGRTGGEANYMMSSSFRERNVLFVPSTIEFEAQVTALFKLKD